MTKFITVFSAACVLFLGTTGAFAQDTAPSSFPGTLTATATLASDYVFRGISQSDEGPAVQGAIDYTYADAFGPNLPGIYAGMWGSNVDFNDGDEANTEFDLYAGVSTRIDAIATDIKLGGIYYAYPGADSDLNYDYWEVALSATHDFDGLFALTASYNYSPEFFADTGDAHYPSLAVSVPLPYDFTLNGHVGYQSIEEAPNYWDWSAGVGYTWQGFGLSVNYVDTDLSEPDECLDGCGAKVVFTVSKSF